MIEKRKIVGITGGIGSGKSTVCAIFSTLGVPIYDSDARAKHLMAHNTQLISALRTLLGEEAYSAEGQWNRAFFAEQILKKPETAKKIEQLVHPAVAEDFKTWVTLQPEHAPFLLREAALMIEAKATKGLDALILVLADETTRLKRVLARDPHRSEQDVKLIFEKQLSDQEKLKHAHFVIHNDHKQHLLPQIAQVFTAIKKL
ncbi:MAG: dephospho-CoA kinase [Cytophagales bacterium]|nr:MAG: dephospho-CoA kinase [Cytophagales bacterium]TAF60598.1 MAG: dephospho-CoA kinase [Cytophagales bacterium]